MDTGTMLEKYESTREPKKVENSWIAIGLVGGTLLQLKKLRFWKLLHNKILLEN